MPESENADIQTPPILQDLLKIVDTTNVSAQQEGGMRFTPYYLEKSPYYPNAEFDKKNTWMAAASPMYGDSADAAIAAHVSYEDGRITALRANSRFLRPQQLGSSRIEKGHGISLVYSLIELLSGKFSSRRQHTAKVVSVKDNVVCVIVSLLHGRDVARVMLDQEQGHIIGLETL